MKTANSPWAKCLLLLIMALAASTLFYKSGFWSKTLAKENITLLAPHQSLQTFAKELEKAEIISNHLAFYVWTRLFANYQKFQAGRYHFLPGEHSFASIAKMIERGEVYHELRLSLTIPEGYTKNQVFEKIAQESKVLLKELNILDQSAAFRTSLGLADQESLEGYLYPSTYHFYDEDPSAASILSTLKKEFNKRITPEIVDTLLTHQLKLHQAVILASLIEKETSTEQEKPFVAEVIFNRLAKREVLGIDASIIYGIPNYSGNLTSFDLKNKNNKYNLRVHGGLPPGPICSPSLSSILALLNPSKEGYYFYVLKPGPTKEHHFSRSLAEHAKHVRKLVQYQTQGKQ